MQSHKLIVYNNNKAPQIGVVGASHCSKDTAQIAQAVGYEIAGRGGVLICGGEGGVMRAAAMGAKKAGGLTIGILPGNHFSDANRYIDVCIVTDLGHARNALVVHSSQVIIALNGSYGTLSEIALALRLSKPVIGLNSWDIDPKIITAKTPQDAVNKAYQLISQLE